MSKATTAAKSAAQRPLSPHLQVYRLLNNMVMSMLHRMTGAALYFGTLLLAAWLIAAASGPTAFGVVSDLFRSPVGLLVLAGYTWALVHHALGGLRHLIWDTGRGFAIGTVNVMSWATIICSLAITAAIWACILGVRII